ncbi:hypothetical protein NQZ79_g7426 [Umbelopsis isabellina]|nr:hypothetical protein NQZ79_g7426 [Umbelopsis isabellina]
MTIVASPGCAITSLVQPTGGNAQCIGNYVETVGTCSFTALNSAFPAQCDSAYNCVLTYPGGTTHSIICNGSTQTYTSSVLSMSFSGSCTCTISATTPSSSGVVASVPVGDTTSTPSVAAASTATVVVVTSTAVGAPASSVPVAASSGALTSSSPAPALGSANKLGKTSALLFSAIIVSMLISMA